MSQDVIEWLEAAEKRYEALRTSKPPKETWHDFVGRLNDCSRDLPRALQIIRAAVDSRKEIVARLDSGLGHDADGVVLLTVEFILKGDKP